MHEHKFDKIFSFFFFPYFTLYTKSLMIVKYLFYTQLIRKSLSLLDIVFCLFIALEGCYWVLDSPTGLGQRLDQAPLLIFPQKISARQALGRKASALRLASHVKKKLLMLFLIHYILLLYCGIFYYPPGVRFRFTQRLPKFLHKTLQCSSKTVKIYPEMAHI